MKISANNKIKFDKLIEMIKNADQTESKDEMMRMKMFSSTAFDCIQKNDSAKIKKSGKKISKAIAELEKAKVKYELKNENAKT